MKSNDIKTIILTAAGIILVLVVVAFLFSGTFLIKDKAEGSINEAANMMDAAALRTYTDKNGSDLKGTAVLNFISDREPQEDHIAIIVDNTASGGNTVEYVYKTADLDNKITPADEATLKKNAKSKTNAAYISPNATYAVTIEYLNTDGDIKSITFKRQ